MIALYARVSTDRHRCKSCRKVFAIGDNYVEVCPSCGSTDIQKGQDPMTQLLKLREYAIAKEQPFVEYVDRGVSGVKDSRKALDEMMTAARRGEFNAVVVARFDRFARSVSHLVNALDEFRSLGIRFVSLSEAIDTGSVVGRMIFTVLGAVAQLERDIIRERVMAGLDRARAEGKKLGPKPLVFDREKVREHYRESKSLRKTAEKYGISRDTVRRAL